MLREEHIKGVTGSWKNLHNEKLIVCTLHHILFYDEIKDCKMDGHPA
jgi:hypothetical protein